MQKSLFTNEIDLFIDSLGDGVMIVDKEGMIIKSNQAVVNMLGYKSKKSMEGHAILTLLGATGEKGQVIDKKNAAFIRTIRYRKQISNEKRQFVKQDGTRIWTNITTSPLIKNNKAIAAVIMVRDITQETLQEEYYKDFTHTASHNLRSPLGNLLWTMEYLLTKKLGPLNKEQEEYLSDAYESLQAMNRMVNNLLSISRLENKKVHPDFQKVSLEQTIDSITKDLANYARAQLVTFVVKSDKKEVHFVKFDPDHLHSILQNIIENAVRYSFKDKKIVLEIKSDNKNTIFSCTNEGIGIPEGKKDFVFAKFFRAKNAEETQNEGTGLGMYTSRELAILNKSKLWFESTENKQTTFYLELKSF